MVVWYPLVSNEQDNDTNKACPKGMSGMKGKNLFLVDETALRKVKQRGWQGRPVIAEVNPRKVKTPSRRNRKGQGQCDFNEKIKPRHINIDM